MEEWIVKGNRVHPTLPCRDRYVKIACLLLIMLNVGASSTSWPYLTHSNRMHSTSYWHACSLKFQLSCIHLINIVLWRCILRPGVIRLERISTWLHVSRCFNLISGQFKKEFVCSWKILFSWEIGAGIVSWNPLAHLRSHARRSLSLANRYVATAYGIENRMSCFDI